MQGKEPRLDILSMISHALGHGNSDCSLFPKTCLLSFSMFSFLQIKRSKTSQINWRGLINDHGYQHSSSPLTVTLPVTRVSNRYVEVQVCSAPPLQWHCRAYIADTSAQVAQNLVIEYLWEPHCDNLQSMRLHSLIKSIPQCYYPKNKSIFSKHVFVLNKSDDIFVSKSEAKNDFLLISHVIVGFSRALVLDIVSCLTVESVQFTMW